MIEGMSGQKMTQINQDDLLWQISDENYYRCLYALKSTIVLHKEKIDMNGYGACEECSRTAYYNVPWPCKTIKEISDELFIDGKKTNQSHF